MTDAALFFEFIFQEVKRGNTVLSVAEMCELSGVSRSGYYAWVSAAEKRQQAEEQDRKDFERILDVYRRRGIPKGARSIHMMLRQMDPPVVMNVKKIRRLMRKYNLMCPIRRANPYRKIMKDLQTSHVAPNLVQREFEKYGPRVVLLTDITYIPRTGGNSYLSTVIDAYTKEILAYRVSDSLAVTFVISTMRDLAAKHGKELGDTVVIHSDQGSHYTSCAFQEILSGMSFLQSMSRRGNCLDNAVQESFFGHMKDDVGERLRDCTNADEVRAVIDEYIEYYNDERPQLRLAKLTPSQFYRFSQTGTYPLAVDPVPQKPAPVQDSATLRMRAERVRQNTHPEESADQTAADIRAADDIPVPELSEL